jgi:hypothetical protein
MNTITTRGLVGTLWRRLVRRITRYIVQWEYDAYNRDLDVLRWERANNLECERLITSEQMRRKARLNDLKR